jgi:two-component system NtrC family sensor kinase
MTLYPKRFSRSITLKLILSLGLLMIIGWCISWYTLIHVGKRNLLAGVIYRTASNSELVKKSTRYSMLTFNREAIQQTVEEIGSTKDIEGIRIFNNKGRVYYSSKREEIGRQVDRGAKACIGCHADPMKPSESLTGDQQWVTYTGTKGHRVLTFVEPIYNDPSCSNAACHIHPQSQRVVGVLETDFSLLPLDNEIRRQTIATTVYAVLFAGIIFAMLYAILRKILLGPLSSLSIAMKKVAGGDLAQRVDLDTQDEIGLLAQTFNTMTGDLEAAKLRMEHWNQALEEEVTRKTDELRKSQGKLVEAEKLAALGRLTADVAHEIRNPLTAVGGFARRLHKEATTEKERKYAEIVETEVGRLEKILRDVLIFSREARFFMERHSMNEAVRAAALLYRDECAEGGITIRVEILDDLPAILMDKDQMLQALGNLITNAEDAMQNGGTLELRTGMEKIQNATFIYVKVSDTGTGIDADKLPLIFEPFFSTKVTGRGTGLGLSITRKIMEEHGGFVKAESMPGKGSAFSLYFPYQSEEDSLKTPCWEYMQCGRDRDATRKCPAYPHFGRLCWVVAGTFCKGKVQGSFASKGDGCDACPFFREAVEEEQGGFARAESRTSRRTESKGTG